MHTMALDGGRGQKIGSVNVLTQHCIAACFDFLKEGQKCVRLAQQQSCIDTAQRREMNWGSGRGRGEGEAGREGGRREREGGHHW